MRRWSTSLIVTVLGLLCLQRNDAGAVQRASFGVYGPVDVSCGTFATSKDVTREVYEWWALGFVSGADMVRADQGRRLTPTDGGGAIAWIAKYCADHPLEPFVKATISLVEELSLKKTGQ